MIIGSNDTAAPQSSVECPGCLGREIRSMHRATERMFGAGGIFDYAECSACKTLWLVDIPELKQFYPSDYYYSMSARRFSWLFEVYAAVGLVRLLRRLHHQVRKTAEILDVGCGEGTLLRGLRHMGYRNVRGIDPFLAAPVNKPPIVNRRLSEIDEVFDFIMFHHSLEHIPEAEDTLRTAIEHLRPGGVVLVRIPVVNYAWERYGTRWVQLDAPRHVFLFSTGGFSALAERVGFRVASCEYDSTSFQFWGSELYERGGHLSKAYPADPIGKILFSLRMALRYGLQTTTLNKLRLGDQAAFLLCKR